MDANLIGCMAEIKIASALLENGHQVSRPLADNCVYDLIAEIDKRLVKIQVKGTTKKPNKYGVAVDLVRHRKYEKCDVDYYAVWVQHYDGFFFFKNNNQKAIRLNKDGKYKTKFNTFALR